MSPKAYFLTMPKGCILSIMGNHPDDIDGDQTYMMGDAFLRHFYQVYDYDQQKVRLAVDVHSQDIVSIGDNLWVEILIFTGLAIGFILFSYGVYRYKQKKKQP